MSQDAIFILKQIRSVIDDFLSKVESKEEPTPTIVKSSNLVYTSFSDLSIDVQHDYRKADKATKKMMEKLLNLEPSE
jgi:hypothetical protein